VRNAAQVSPTSEPERPDVVKLLLNLLAGRLQTGDPAATVDRLFSSQHVKDLQLIVAVAFMAAVLILLLRLPLFVENELMNPAPSSGWAIVHAMLVGAQDDRVVEVTEYVRR
jgi:hypothetical protein